MHMIYINAEFFSAQKPLVDQGFIIKASRSHSDTPHSVRLLWTSDRPDAEPSTWQHTIHAYGRAATGIGSK
jgi:hypothetical protein